MEKIDFQIADNFCEEALIELANTHPSSWIVLHKDLFESISIKPEGRPSIANQNYGGIKYDYIGQFHSIYEHKVYEENILNERSQYEAIVYFIERLNIDKIDELLDYQEYSDKDKPIFIEMLKGAFERFKEAGNKRLYRESGECKGCNKGCKGFAFIGDLDGSHIELVIEKSNDRVKDIYYCNIFSYLAESPGPRIQLDPNEMPF
jgi:hypothetical protein